MFSLMKKVKKDATSQKVAAFSYYKIISNLYIHTNIFFLKNLYKYFYLIIYDTHNTHFLILMVIPSTNSDHNIVIDRSTPIPGLRYARRENIYCRGYNVNKVSCM